MTTEQHREETIKMYEMFLNDLSLYKDESETPNLDAFRKLMFERAILYLKKGHKPKKVENWVVSIENKWIYFK